MTKDCIIVDLDGTLCKIDHRLHFIATKPKNYDAFHNACVNDLLITPVFELVAGMHERGVEIIFVSGRSDSVRKQTEAWLKKHDVPYAHLLMRRDKDYRKDSIIKKEILDDILNMGYNVLFAIDDRKQVKRMWVENGVFVFDVNQKDVEF